MFVLKFIIMSKKILFHLLLIFLLNNSVISQQKIEFPNWLLGTWIIETESGNSYEVWEKVSENHLKGRIYRIFGSDTIIFDTMNIKIFDKNIIYELTATVDKKRVYASYTLKRPTNELWKFENNYVDYPKAINYNLYSNDSVYVWTEAKDENTACIDFIMRRKK